MYKNTKLKNLISQEGKLLCYTSGELEELHWLVLEVTSLTLQIASSVNLTIFSSRQELRSSFKLSFSSLLWLWFWWPSFLWLFRLASLSVWEFLWWPECRSRDQNLLYSKCYPCRSNFHLHDRFSHTRNKNCIIFHTWAQSTTLENNFFWDYSSEEKGY